MLIISKMSIQSTINSEPDGSVNFELLDYYIDELIDNEGYREVYPPFDDVEIGDQIKYIRTVEKNGEVVVKFRTGGWIMLDEKKYWVFKSHGGNGKSLKNWSLQKNEVIRLFARPNTSVRGRKKKQKS